MAGMEMMGRLSEMSGEEKQDIVNGFTTNMQYGTGSWWDSVAGGDQLNTDAMDSYVKGKLLKR